MCRVDGLDARSCRMLLSLQAKWLRAYLRQVLARNVAKTCGAVAGRNGVLVGAWVWYDWVHGHELDVVMGILWHSDLPQPPPDSADAVDALRSGLSISHCLPSSLPLFFSL